MLSQKIEKVSLDYHQQFFDHHVGMIKPENIDYRHHKILKSVVFVNQASIKAFNCMVCSNPVLAPLKCRDCDKCVCSICHREGNDMNMLDGCPECGV